MIVELEELKRAVYETVFDKLGGPDCLFLKDPAQGRRFLADLREYLDRYVIKEMIEETDAEYYPLNCAGTWHTIATAYDGKFHPDYGFEYAFDDMCDSLVERALEKYAAPQGEIDKVWFDNAFEIEAEAFEDGEYFSECD